MKDARGCWLVILSTEVFFQRRKMKVMVVDLRILEVSLQGYLGMDKVMLVEFQRIPMVLV